MSKQKKKQKANIGVLSQIIIGAVILSLTVAASIYLINRQPKTAPQPTPALTDLVMATAVQPSPKKWDSAPEMALDMGKKYKATFKMAKGGEFTAELYPDKAPITVNSFVFLVRSGYFNGTTFHRVLEGFMAQGGDPTGTGSGGPGYEFVNEDSDLTFDKPGVLAMANASTPGLSNVRSLSSLTNS